MLSTNTMSSVFHSSLNATLSSTSFHTYDKKAKKKRIAPATTEEPARKRLAEAVTAPEVKQKKVTKDKQATESGGNGNKKKRKKKEVIDYSAMQAENEAGGGGGVGAAVGTGGGGVADNADPKSKVRSWLLASQCRVEPPISALSKSKSTPVGLTTPAGAPARPSGGRIKHVTLRRLTDPKSRSLGSLTKNDSKTDRVRLQVVYKPPFKFSVKLRKADKVGQTPGAHGPTRNAGPRTGVLVRTKKDKGRINHAKQIHAPNKINSTCIPEPPNSDLHTVPSDLEVLLSESEFLFSDA